MKFKQLPLIGTLYLMALVAVIVAREIGIDWLHFLSKPLLMPLLVCLFWINVRPANNLFTKFITAALILSWLGDIFMMFQQTQPLFFLLGLGAFLLGHVFYIGSFTRRYKKEDKAYVTGKGMVLRQPLWILPLLLYGGGLYYYLYPHLGEMKVPVVVYSVAITLMALTAANRKGRVSYLSFRYILIGALLFVLSDSVIALNTFKYFGNLNNAAFWIMLPYGLGQLLIVIGAIYFVKERNSVIVS